MAKKALKWLGIVLGVVALAFVGLVAWLTVREYKPAAVEDVEAVTWRERVNQLAPGGDLPFPAVGDTLTILSQNTGYCGLGVDSDRRWTPTPGAPAAWIKAPITRWFWTAMPAPTP